VILDEAILANVLQYLGFRYVDKASCAVIWLCIVVLLACNCNGGPGGLGKDDLVQVAEVAPSRVSVLFEIVSLATQH
jgi:hypothetical protein